MSTPERTYRVCLLQCELCFRWWYLLRCLISRLLARFSLNGLLRIDPSGQHAGSISKAEILNKESHLGRAMLQEHKIPQCITVAQCGQCLVFVCYPQDAAYLPSLLEWLLGDGNLLKCLQVPDSHTVGASTCQQSPI
jgi:hypothetical protein